MENMIYEDFYKLQKLKTMRPDIELAYLTSEEFRNLIEKEKEGKYGNPTIYCADYPCCRTERV